MKNPWSDGWEQARSLALDLVEEAKLLAKKQVLLNILINCFIIFFNFFKKKFSFALRFS